MLLWLIIIKHGQMHLLIIIVIIYLIIMFNIMWLKEHSLDFGAGIACISLDIVNIIFFLLRTLKIWQYGNVILNTRWMANSVYVISWVSLFFFLFTSTFFFKYGIYLILTRRFLWTNICENDLLHYFYDIICVK